MWRGLLVALVTIGAAAAQAAHLNCTLFENSKAVKTLDRPISIPSDPKSFQFDETIDGNDYVGSVQWSKDVGVLALRLKTDKLGSQSATFWENPLDQGFFVSHGGASMSCSVDVSDGQSYAWTRFRERFGDNESVMASLLNSVKRLAEAQPKDESESEQLDNALCMSIGRFVNSSFPNDWELKLLSFESSHTTLVLFPKADEYYHRFLISTVGMQNFCVGGVIDDPNPIAYKDRPALAKRATEIIDLMNETLRYLDQRFPNK